MIKVIQKFLPWGWESNFYIYATWKTVKPFVFADVNKDLKSILFSTGYSKTFSISILLCISLRTGISFLYRFKLMFPTDDSMWWFRTATWVTVSPWLFLMASNGVRSISFSFGCTLLNNAAIMLGELLN